MTTDQTPIRHDTVRQLARREAEKAQRRLDRALEDTFPASDPVAANIFT